MAAINCYILLTVCNLELNITLQFLMVTGQESLAGVKGGVNPAMGNTRLKMMMMNGYSKTFINSLVKSTETETEANSQQRIIYYSFFTNQLIYM